MKHLKTALLSLLFLAAIASPGRSEAQATIQTYTLVCVTNTGTVKVRDTASAADTVYMKMATGVGTPDSGAIRIGGDVVYDWAVVASITATTTGTVSIWGSDEGTFCRTMGASGASLDWVPLISDVTQYNGSSSISVAATGTTYGHFLIKGCQFKYVWLRFVTSGAGQTSTITGKARIRPKG